MKWYLNCTAQVSQKKKGGESTDETSDQFFAFSFLFFFFLKGKCKITRRLKKKEPSLHWHYCQAKKGGFFVFVLSTVKRSRF